MDIMKIMKLRNENRILLKRFFTKKKLCKNHSFLTESKSKFNLNAEGDVDNSEDDSFTDFDKYDLDQENFLILKMTLYSEEIRKLYLVVIL